MGKGCEKDEESHSFRKERGLERMRPEEVAHMTELIDKIVVLIEETGYSYQAVMRALEAIKSNYEKKGHDLLNSINIQKVAEFNGLLL